MMLECEVLRLFKNLTGVISHVISTGRMILCQDLLSLDLFYEPITLLGQLEEQWLFRGVPYFRWRAREPPVSEDGCLCFVRHGTHFSNYAFAMGAQVLFHTCLFNVRSGGQHSFDGTSNSTLISTSGQIA
jgi:hypothetical protein